MITGEVVGENWTMQPEHPWSQHLISQASGVMGQLDVHQTLFKYLDSIPEVDIGPTDFEFRRDGSVDDAEVDEADVRWSVLCREYNEDAHETTFHVLPDERGEQTFFQVRVAEEDGTERLASPREAQLLCMGLLTLKNQAPPTRRTIFGPWRPRRV